MYTALALSILKSYFDLNQMVLVIVNFPQPITQEFRLI
jgi:hypothetical protein